MLHGDINKQRLGEWERGSEDWNRVYCVQESFFLVCKSDIYGIFMKIKPSATVTYMHLSIQGLGN